MRSLRPKLRRFSVVVQSLTLLLLAALLSPFAKAQDTDAAQELLDLSQKMQSADDPCPYLPRMRELLNRIANSDPDVYSAMKPQLDQINAMDLSCKGSDQPTQQQDSNSSDDANAAPAQPPAPATPAKPAVPFSVRYTTAETRSLTDAESAKLRSELHYEPASAPVSVGGSATTVLKDESGASLVSVTVRWINVVRNGTIRNAKFHVTMKNASNCLFSSSAKFLIPSSPIDAQGISFATWISWVTLHEPNRGEQTDFDGIATLGDNYQSLVFTPDQPEVALSQCRTLPTDSKASGSN
jgi:hypothetical protein